VCGQGNWSCPGNRRAGTVVVHPHVGRSWLFTRQIASPLSAAKAPDKRYPADAARVGLVQENSVTPKPFWIGAASLNRVF